MIPSLVLVRSKGSRLFTLTFKRNLKIGSTVDSDVLVNHPELDGHDRILGPASDTGNSSRGKRTILYRLLPVHSLWLDDLGVRMIPLKTVLIVMFLLVGGSLAFKNSPPNGSPRQGKQDWTPITLPARDAYGFCRQDRRHREGVLFTFDSAVPRPYRLLFYTGGNGDEGAIELFLNDEPVGKPLLLPAGWGRELTIRLPSAAVRKGKNTIKIRPATGMPGSVHWGVRDVRVLSENHFRPESLFSTPDRLETVRRALSRNQMGGMELARCYDMIRSWNNRDDPGMSLAEKDRLLKTVEGRMKDELRKVALQVRSREVLGMTPEVEKLLSQTSGWIPFDWSEGWEIYNELSR